MKLKNIIVGKYFFKDSFIHKLDPRTKLISILILLPTIAITGDILYFSGLIILLFYTVFLAKIPYKHFFKQLFPFLWIVFITFIIHILFTDGRILIQIPVINTIITYEGAYNGFIYSTRILMLLAYSNLFMLTTAPVAITDGIEQLCKPLKKLNMPVDAFALIINIALRFIPTIFEETERIKKAQIARGADIEKGVIKRIRNISYIIIPVFVSVYRRADELAVAMKARGYPPRTEKTYYNSLSLTAGDIGIIIFVILLNGIFLIFDLFIY